MLFAHDSRTLEIAEYFSIPHINLNNTNKIYDANEIYSMVDLGPLKQKYASNLDNYAKFLRKNNLETIVDNVNKMAEFDKRIKPEMLNLSIQPLTTQPESIGKRLHWLKNNYDYKLSKI